MPVTKKSRTAATGTTRCVSVFCRFQAPCLNVGARTNANTTPVKVMATVPMYLITYQAVPAGFCSRRRTSPTAQISAIRMLDWIVKNIKTRLPPMKIFRPAPALLRIPMTAETITMIFSAMERMLAFKDGFIWSSPCQGKW